MDNKWDSVYYDVEAAHTPAIDYATYWGNLATLRDEVLKRVKMRTYHSLAAVTKTVIYHG